MRLQHGFSLLEILVALLVLKIGLLGILTAQTVSLRQLQDAIQRTQAVALSSGLFHLMQSNSHLVQHVTTPLTLQTELLPAEQCHAISPCPPAEASRSLLNGWFSQLRGTEFSPLSKPVFCAQSAASSIKLQVSWQQRSANEVGIARCEPAAGRSGFAVSGYGG